MLRITKERVSCPHYYIEAGNNAYLNFQKEGFMTVSQVLAIPVGMFLVYVLWIWFKTEGKFTIIEMFHKGGE